MEERSKVDVESTPNDISSLSDVWVYANKPIDHLLWDPGEWKWQIISAQGMLGKKIPFFSTR